MHRLSRALIFFLPTVIASTTHAAQSQCGMVNANNRWLLNQPCSIFVDANFVRLIEMGLPAGIENALRKARGIMERDCLGVDAIIQRELNTNRAGNALDIDIRSQHE